MFILWSSIRFGSETDDYGDEDKMHVHKYIHVHQYTYSVEYEMYYS